MTERQMAIADEICALRPGHSVHINDKEITRVAGSDSELYTVNCGRVLTFYETYQEVVNG